MAQDVAPVEPTANGVRVEFPVKGEVGKVVYGMSPIDGASIETMQKLESNAKAATNATEALQKAQALLPDQAKHIGTAIHGLGYVLGAGRSAVESGSYNSAGASDFNARAASLQKATEDLIKTPNDSAAVSRFVVELGRFNGHIDESAEKMETPGAARTRGTIQMANDNTLPGRRTSECAIEPFAPAGPQDRKLLVAPMQASLITPLIAPEEQHSTILYSQTRIGYTKVTRSGLVLTDEQKKKVEEFLPEYGATDKEGRQRVDTKVLDTILDPVTKALTSAGVHETKANELFAQAEHIRLMNIGIDQQIKDKEEKIKTLNTQIANGRGNTPAGFLNLNDIRTEVRNTERELTKARTVKDIADKEQKKLKDAYDKEVLAKKADQETAAKALVGGLEYNATGPNAARREQFRKDMADGKIPLEGDKVPVQPHTGGRSAAGSTGSTGSSSAGSATTGGGQRNNRLAPPPPPKRDDIDVGANMFDSLVKDLAAIGGIAINNVRDPNNPTVPTKQEVIEDKLARFGVQYGDEVRAYTNSRDKNDPLAKALGRFEKGSLEIAEEKARLELLDTKIADEKDEKRKETLNKEREDRVKAIERKEKEVVSTLEMDLVKGYVDNRSKIEAFKHTVDVMDKQATASGSPRGGREIDPELAELQRQGKISMASLQLKQMEVRELTLEAQRQRAAANTHYTRPEAELNGTQRVLKGFERVMGTIWKLGGVNR